MKGNLWMEIRSEKKKGLSYAEIGRKHHIDPRTAKKYAETEEVPKYTLKQKRPSKLDPYKDYIDALLEEDNYSRINFRTHQRMRMSMRLYDCKRLCLPK
ncbi:MAG: hypothetical protein J6K43_07890, partial [Lachnospiraceae bacterium]|nr:hypothetical protein [Lachnospiraceae bacterium]